jgi:cytochrome d ubiquinol oxidase subunit II
MSHEALIYAVAAAALVGLMAYVVLGGADFGGGVWDLFAAGPRRHEQRAAIKRAMGPVWEANDVWLIFVLVVLFTCFPFGYGPLAVALFVPFHLALVGIMLRGASFVFRGFGAAAGHDGALGVWGAVFGIASIIAPFLLGASFGAITEGGVRVGDDGQVNVGDRVPWLSVYAVVCGLLALATCAYLAAVYLTNETDGELREDFRRRAIVAGTATAALAGATLLCAWLQAPWFFRQLTSLRSLPVLAAGLVCFGASAWSVFSRRYALSRVFAAGEIVLLLLGWGLAHHRYLIYPDLTLERAAAPPATLAFVLWSLPFGAVLLGPSLWLLFRVFKGRA